MGGDRPDRSACGATPFDDDVPWRAWTPGQVLARFQEIRTPTGAPVRWAVAAGWALDLFHGRTTREHEDLEIVVLTDDVPSVLAAFGGPDWDWKVPTDGWLHALESSAYTQTHQTWLWSQSAAAFVLDVFRDEHDGDTWICRRDRTITMPWTTVTVQHPRHPPYLIPEVVLLFKAKHARPKDVRDLELALPALDERQRGWLRTSIGRVHPGHDWLALI